MRWPVFSDSASADQRLLLHLVGQQDEARAGLVVVELGEEGPQHLGFRQGAVGAGIIGAVAPILAGAEEEHLDAGGPALLVAGEHVRLLHPAGVDALRALHGRERGQAITQARGPLELQLLGRRLHLQRQLFLHGAGAAGEEGAGLAHQLRIVGVAHLAGAGTGAALDLVQQAGPRAIFIIAVGARAQQEGALQRVDGAIHRPHAGERPVIIPRPVARAAMLGDLRRHVIGGDEDVGKRLVVPQQHVEARLQLLDEVGLQQQRFRFGAGGDELHGSRGGDHPRDAVSVAHRARIAQHPLLDALGLAHIEHGTVRRDHAIDARPCRGMLDRADDGIAPAGKAFRAGRRRVGGVEDKEVGLVRRLHRVRFGRGGGLVIAGEGDLGRVDGASAGHGAYVVRPAARGNLRRRHGR